MLFELLVVVPILAASVLSLIIGRRSRSAAAYTSIAASVASMLMVVYLVMHSLPSIHTFEWFQIGSYSVNLAVTTAHINMLLLLLVSIIAPLIMWYSLGFMDKRDEQGRFFFEMNLFTASMMLFAISANFILMFIAWGALGITSYLLIGFWYSKKLAPKAARKSITTIIIGDIAMLSAIIILWNTYGTFSFAQILGAAAAPGLYVAALLLIVALFTKSAQFPFTEWLADAMEGPTPVSAFLHSSTMVKAGAFLGMVLLPIFAKAGVLPVFLVFGAISAILGVMNAVSERHIKRILAYSTIEDIGLMFVAIGLGSIPAAIMLFVVQTFYKALLFMSAGSIMRGNNEKENIFALSGTSSNKLLFGITIVGVLSIAGIFPFSGFFGKIGLSISAPGVFIYLVLATIEFGSSIYIFRWLLVPMRKPAAPVTVSRLRSLPKSMIAPGIVLAALVFAADAAYFMLPPYLGISHVSIGIIGPVIETAIVVLGFVVAYTLYRKASRFVVHKSPSSALYNSVWVNSAYSGISILFLWVASALSYVDRAIFFAVYAAGRFVLWIGRELRKIVSGNVSVYVAGMVIGMIFLVIFVVFLQ